MTNILETAVWRQEKKKQTLEQLQKLLMSQEVN